MYAPFNTTVFRLAIASTAAAFVSTPGGFASRSSGIHRTTGLCRAALPWSRLKHVRKSEVAVCGVRMQVGGMAADEDDWYDSEKWESFRKSGARVPGARADEDKNAKAPDSSAGDFSVDVQREQEKEGKRQGTNPNVEWLRIAGCDVCLPKERKRPMEGPRFTGLVHFIGGAFVGTLPRQAYGVLIENMVAKGRLVVIATPCSGLAGMDHYKAAYEAAFKFQTASSILRTDLGADVFDADELPTIGVAHSLGCKVQVLMNSISDTREAVGISSALMLLLLLLMMTMMMDDDDG